MNENLSVRELIPQDAQQLSALFLRCYGNRYIYQAFYDVKSLSEKIATQELISVVAVQRQKIVGHIGICKHHSDAITCETGNTVVDPSLRGQGLLLRLGAALHKLVSSKGYIGYLHYPTTAHTIMQVASTAYGGIETGLMLAYTPNVGGLKENNRSTDRVAATVVYQGLANAPLRTVILPKSYHQIIADRYKALNLNRTIGKAIDSDSYAELNPALLHDNYNPQQGLLHIYVSTGGGKIHSKVAALINKYQPDITHIDLPLDGVNIDRNISDLKKLGFFFCALLPEFAHTDLLRLQRVSVLTPDTFEAKVINQDAISLAKFIRNDASLN